MVFLTGCSLLRQRKFGRPGLGTDKFWRVQQYLRFAWRFEGRKRNCFGISMRYVHKALMYSTTGRTLKKENMRNLWNERIDAAGLEHGISRYDFLEGLAKSNVQLDRKVLADIAIYEPRTFQSLTEIAKRTLDETEGSSVDPLQYGFWRR